MNIGTLTASLVLNDQFSSGLMVAARNIDQVSARLDRFGARAEQVGGTLSTRLTLPLLALGGIAVRSGAEFERAINQVSAVANATAAEVRQLTDAATEWGQKTKFSNTEAAQAMLELSKAGFTVQETIDALPSTLELATAANLGLAEAASLTANTLKTFKLETTDLARANDVLTAAANKSTIDVADLRETLKYVGPVAAVAKVSLADVAAASAMLGTNGIKGSMAGTALRMTFTQLLAPSKDTAKLLTELGFAQELAAGKTVLWTDMLEGLRRRMDESQASADRFGGMVMEAFGQRAGPAVIAMASQGGDAIRQFSEELDRTSMGSAKRMSDAFMKGVPGALEQLQGALETAASKLEQMFAPAIIGVTNLAIAAADVFTTRLAPAFMALPAPIQNVAFALTGLAIAAGPFLVFLGTASRLAGVVAAGISAIGRALPAVAGLGAIFTGLRIFITGEDFKIGSDRVLLWVTRFTTFSEALKSAVGIVGNLGRALTVLASPLTAAAAGAAAIVTWFVRFTDVGPFASRILQGLWSILKDLAGITGGVLVLAWRSFIGLIEDAAGGVRDAWNGFSQLFRTINDLARAVLDTQPWFRGFVDVLAAVGHVVAIIAEKVRGVRQELDALLAVTGRASLPNVAAPSVPAPGGPLAVPDDPFGFLGPRAGGTTSVVDGVTKAVDSLRDAQAQLVTQARAWVQFAGSDVARLPQAVIDDYHDALQNVIDQYGSLEAAGLGAYSTIYDALTPLTTAARDQANELEAWLERGRQNATAYAMQQAQQLSQSMDAFRASVRAAAFDPKRHPLFQLAMPSVSMTPAPSHWTTLGRDLVQSFTTGGFSQQLGDTVMRALTGGGSVSNSVGALAGQQIGQAFSGNFGEMVKGALGSKVGGAIASFLPGIGTLIGPLIGKGLSALGGLLGFGSAGRDLVTDFAGQMGGFNQLHDRLLTLGEAGEQLWVRLTQGVGRNDKAGAQAAIDAITAALQRSEAALQRYGLTIDDLRAPADRAAESIVQLGEDLDTFLSMGVGDMGALSTRLADPLNQALRTALETGQALPASMQPFLEALTRSGGLADDVARKLLGLPAPDLAPWRDMEDAAERYGIAIDALGPKFQQSKLIEGAEALANDWALLVGNGADVNAVMDGMSEKANTFLTNALKWGLQVPASMRPMLQAMLDAGLLVDENGVKLEDLDDVNWGLDLQAAIDDLIGKLGELFDRILGIPDPEITPHINAPTGWDGRIDVTYNPNMPNDPYGGLDPSDPANGFSGGTRGLRNFDPGGEWAKLHGREEVLTAGQSAGIAQWVHEAVSSAIAGASQSSASTPMVAVYIGDEQLKPRAVEWVTRAVEQNDGAGAPVGPTARLAKALAKRIQAYQ